MIRNIIRKYFPLAQAKIYPENVVNKQELLRKNELFFLQSIYFYFTFFLWSCHSLLYSQTLFSETDQELTYELLRSQVNVYKAHLSLDLSNKKILMEADSLAQNGEFDLSIIYLEEILELFRAVVDSEQSLTLAANQSDLNGITAEDRLNISLLSGVDFDRHEFEYGYEQSDSTLLEEINKPYIGINTEYVLNNTFDSTLSIYNSIRYDKEFIRDDYQLSFGLNRLNVILGGYYNKSFIAAYSSYWEHKFQGAFTSQLLKNFKLIVRENFNYKTFSQADFTYTDYYRNYLEGLGEIYLQGWSLYTQYSHEINELLGNSDNDYQQHKFTLGYWNSEDWDFKHHVSTEFIHRTYELIYGDSVYANNYNQISLEAEVDFRLSENMKFQIGENITVKSYNFKSTFEPDYTWNFLRPVYYYNLLPELQIGLGYEWEVKNHTKIEESGISSLEQNYNSQGIFSSLNYFSENGTFLSCSISYQWRRYPESPTNDLINIYSSRNILSLMVMGYIPIYKNIKLNILGLYDNDKDIDNDQGKTQSSIINVEVEYAL